VERVITKPNNMQNQFDVVLSKLTEEEKDEIVKLKEQNLKDMNSKNTYNNTALNHFFNLWSRHFPQVRQSKNCKGCRKSVVAFYHNLADVITKK